MDLPLKCLADNYPHLRISKDKCARCRRRALITFDMIPDDVLLEIFDFYVHDGVVNDTKYNIEEWIRLAHVCRRWRSVVFQSRIRLDLRLVCTPETPTRDILDIWPPLPLIIRDFDYYPHRPFVEDNIIAALRHNDRVCRINLMNAELGYFTNSAAILKPFPELTFLQLSGSGSEPILPDSFLGGSAPRLRSLTLEKVPFPRLPKLLLSTTRLVYLDLSSIPRSGYIPPEAMATTLSALTSLDFFWLRFDYPPPGPVLEARRPPPLTRYILPNLIRFEFRGASEYLEVILARFDAPRLDGLGITFFNQLIFDTPQLFQFINRRPILRAPEKGQIEFHQGAVTVKFPSQTSNHDVFNVGIWSTPSDWQLSSLEQVCASLPPVSTLEDLYIFENQGIPGPPYWQVDIENSLWLALLHRFSAAKNLYLSEEFVPRIAPALQELVGGRTTEVLPSLENIFLESSQQSRRIEKFVAARRLASRPVAVSRWDRYSN